MPSSPFQFSSQQIADANALAQAHNYPQMYRLLAQAVTAGGGDPALANWFNTAAHINANDGTFYSNFVRTSTLSAGLSIGEIINHADFQVASDQLANDIILDLVNAERTSKSGLGSGQLSIDYIIFTDVQATIQLLALKPADWAGVLGGLLPVSAGPVTVGGLGLDMNSPYYIALEDKYKKSGIFSLETLMDFGRVARNTYFGFSGALGGVVKTQFYSVVDAFSNLSEYVAHTVNNGTPTSTGTAPPPGISAAAGTAGARAAVSPPRRDPLVLDLDGDGIETVGIGGTGSIILFDHNADGIKTGTGWVAPDDGWLVLDRNGNGTIDSGRELFGVDTIKTNGSFANDGFDALRDVDANKDGKITSADSVFSNLRIWRDMNQDGISQAAEITTLSANNITAIGVNVVSTDNTNLGNGNVQTAAGSFTRSNGSTGVAGETIVETTSTAANLNLLVNTFYRQFTDRITLTAQAAALPDLHGSGRVRDLSEAISLSTDLGNWVQTYTQQTTRQAQVDQLDGFVERWANTSDLSTLKAQAAALAGRGGFLNYSFETGSYSTGSAAYNDFIRKIGVVERFMGFTYGGPQGQARLTPLDASAGRFTVFFGLDQIANINQAYDRIKADIYESFLVQTRLNGYLNKLEITLVNNQFALNFQPVENAFKQAMATNPRDGMLDLIEFISAVGVQRLADAGWGSIGFLTTQLNAAPDFDTAFSEMLSSWTVRLAAATEHVFNSTTGAGISNISTSANNPQSTLLVATAGADSIVTSNENDIILGKGGDDTIQASGGNDIIDGGAGNDTLYAGAGNDTFVFGKGDGQDIIRAAGTTSTAVETNTLQFRAGVAANEINVSIDGTSLVLAIIGSTDKVTIEAFFYNDDIDNNATQVQQVMFADGTVWNKTTLKNKALQGTANAETINGTIAADIINGHAGDDRLYGRAGNDTLQGGDGNDALYGEAGDDTLDGGSGNDTLNGGTGNNTYLFGRGDGQDLVYTDPTSTVGRFSVLQFKAGVAASDVQVTTYGSTAALLSIAGTTDSVRINSVLAFNDPSNRYNPVQQIRFADGASWNMAALTNKMLAGTAGADTLVGSIADDTINGQAGADTLSGSDGNDTINGGADNDTLYGENDNDALYGDAGSDTLYGGNGDDVLNGGTEHDMLYGDSGNDTLMGGLGQDYLYGGAGNDTLEGNAGNDMQAGGTGNDTYLFGKGDGQDTIDADNEVIAGKLNVLQFKTGVLPSEVVATRSFSTLVLSITGTADKVTVNSFFSGDDTNNTSNPIQQVKFDDGTTWNATTITAMMFAGTAGSDNIVGTIGADLINGQAGADTLYGRDGNDILNGGADNDTLYGDNGNDVLQGGTGSDTYGIDVNNGQDTIDNASTDYTTAVDTIAFGWGIDETKLFLSRESNDLMVSVLGASGTAGAVATVATNTVRVKNHFVTGVAADGTHSQIDRITFKNSSVYGTTEITNLVASTKQLAMLTTRDVAVLSTAQVAALTTDQIGALSTTQLTALNTEQVAGMLRVQVAALNTKQLNVLTTTQIAAIESRDLIGLTTAQVVALTTTQLASITTLQISGLTTTQLPTLSTSQIVAMLRAQFAALNTKQLNTLTTTQIAAIESRDLVGLTTAQVVALTTSQLASITTLQISGLTTTQLPTLSTSQIAAMLRAQFVALNTKQLNALTTTQIAAIETRDLVGLTTAQVAALTTSQVAAITTLGIQVLRTTQVQALTTSDLQALSIDQVSALTSSQLAVLSAEQLAALPFASPIALDMNGDGHIETLSVNNGVVFDINANGQSTRTGWIAPSDGLLVLDRNHDGVINSGAELFGTATLLGNGKAANNGYTALTELDTNGDGVINSNDKAYANLNVWTDSNSDGISQADELQSLESANIVSINVNAKSTSTLSNGNWVGLTSSFETIGGAVRESADVWFMTSPQQTNQQQMSTLSETMNAYYNAPPFEQTTQSELAQHTGSRRLGSQPSAPPAPQPPLALAVAIGLFDARSFGGGTPLSSESANQSHIALQTHAPKASELGVLAMGAVRS